MGDNITQAERLLSTIMAARSRVRGLASGLPFDAASRIEARSTVGSSPVRQDMEVVHEMLETRVRAWRRTALEPPAAEDAPEQSLFEEFSSPSQEAPDPTQAPPITTPSDPAIDASLEAVEPGTAGSGMDDDSSQNEEVAVADEMAEPHAHPWEETETWLSDDGWDTEEDLAPAMPIAPPDAPIAKAPQAAPSPLPVRQHSEAQGGHYDFRREDPVLPAAPRDLMAETPTPVQQPTPVEVIAELEEEAHDPPEPLADASDLDLPAAPPDLPTILNAAPPARPPRQRKKLPPPHPALASAAPPALAQPRAVAPRIVDPNAPGMTIDFQPAAPTDTGAALKAAPELTPAPPPSQPSVPSPAPVGSVEVFDTLTRAGAAIDAGRLEEAITLYGDTLDLEPDHIDARLGRGMAYLHLGQLAAAMSDFQRAEDSVPESPAPLVAMGDLFFTRKDYTRATASYDQALDIDPGHAMALCRRGICHHYRGRPDLALRDLSMAQEIDPGIPSIDRYVAMVGGNSRRR